MSISFDFKKIWTVTLVFYLICSTAFVYGTLKPLNSIALYLFLAVSIFLILVKGKLRLDLPVLTYIFFAVIVMIGTLYSPASQSSVLDVVYDYITMAVLAFCVSQYIETEKDLHVVTIGFMLGGLALAVYVYAQYGSDFWELLEEISDTDSKYTTRLDGNLANANSIGMYAMISTVIAAYYILFTKTKLPLKLVLLAVAVFCIIVSLAAASRKSMIILLVSVTSLWLYFSLGKVSLKRLLRSFLALIVVMVVLIYAINMLPIFGNVLKRLETLFDFLGGAKGTVSEVERFSYIKEGLKIWEQHPLLGAGTNSSRHYFGVYSHSNVVEILMNYGLLGFAVFYTVYGVTLFKFLKNISLYRGNSKLAPLVFALFLSISICGVALVYYYDRYEMLLMMSVFCSQKIFQNGSSQPVAQLKQTAREASDVDAGC